MTPEQEARLAYLSAKYEGPAPATAVEPQGFLPRLGERFANIPGNVVSGLSEFGDKIFMGGANARAGNARLPELFDVAPAQGWQSQTADVLGGVGQMVAEAAIPGGVVGRGARLLGAGPRLARVAADIGAGAYLGQQQSPEEAAIMGGEFGLMGGIGAALPGGGAKRMLLRGGLNAAIAPAGAAVRGQDPWTTQTAVQAGTQALLGSGVGGLFRRKGAAAPESTAIVPDEVIPPQRGKLALEWPYGEARSFSPSGPYIRVHPAGPYEPPAPLQLTYPPELAAEAPTAPPRRLFPQGPDVPPLPTTKPSPAQPPPPQPPKEAPPSAPSLSSDFVPALRESSGAVIPGTKGDVHLDIKARQTQDWRDNNVLADIEGAGAEHGFVKDGKFWTREEVSAALDEKLPMQSERLRELQATEDAVTPAPVTEAAYERAKRATAATAGPDQAVVNTALSKRGVTDKMLDDYKRKEMAALERARFPDPAGKPSKPAIPQAEAPVPVKLNETQAPAAVQHSDPRKFKFSEIQLPETVDDWVALREKRRAAETQLIKEEIGLTPEQAAVAHDIVIVRDKTGDTWAKKNLTPEQLVKWEHFWEESVWNKRSGPVDNWEYDTQYKPELVASETDAGQLAEELVGAFTHGLQPALSDKWVWAVSAAKRIAQLGGTKEDISKALRQQAGRVAGSESGATDWYMTHGKEINDFISHHAPELPLTANKESAAPKRLFESKAAEPLKAETLASTAQMLDRAAALRREAAGKQAPPSVGGMSAAENQKFSVASDKATEEWGAHHVDVLQPAQKAVRAVERRFSDMQIDAARTKPGTKAKFKLTKKALFEKYGVKNAAELNEVFAKENSAFKGAKEAVGKAERESKRLERVKDKALQDWRDASNPKRLFGPSKGESGATHSDILIRLGPHIGGALGGAALGARNDEEHPWRGAALGAAAGWMLPNAGRRLFKTLKNPRAAVESAQKLHALTPKTFSGHQRLTPELIGQSAQMRRVDRRLNELRKTVSVADELIAAEKAKGIFTRRKRDIESYGRTKAEAERDIAEAEKNLYGNTAPEDVAWMRAVNKYEDTNGSDWFFKDRNRGLTEIEQLARQELAELNQRQLTEPEKPSQMQLGDKSEAGSTDLARFSPQIAGAIGGGAVGAANDPENRLRGFALGAAAGALLPSAGKTLFRGIKAQESKYLPGKGETAAILTLGNKRGVKNLFSKSGREEEVRNVVAPKPGAEGSDVGKALRWFDVNHVAGKTKETARAMQRALGKESLVRGMLADAVPAFNKVSDKLTAADKAHGETFLATEANARDIAALEKTAIPQGYKDFLKAAKAAQIEAQRTIGKGEKSMSKRALLASTTGSFQTRQYTAVVNPEKLVLDAPLFTKVAEQWAQNPEFRGVEPEIVERVLSAHIAELGSKGNAAFSAPADPRISRTLYMNRKDFKPQDWSFLEGLSTDPGLHVSQRKFIADMVASKTVDMGDQAVLRMIAKDAKNVHPSDAARLREIADREVLTPEHRALLGEITDPLTRQLYTVNKLANSVKGAEAFNQLSSTVFDDGRKMSYSTKELSDASLSAKPDVAARLKGYQRLPNNEALGKLAGMWVPRDAAVELNAMFDPKMRSGAEKWYAKLNGWMKESLTSLNSSTQVRQYAQVPMMMTAVRVYPHEILKYGQDYVNILRAKGSALHRELMETHMIGGSFAENDLKQLEQQLQFGTKQGILGKVRGGARMIYKHPDDFVRVAGYLKNKPRFLEAAKAKGLTGDAAEKAAQDATMDWVNSHSQNYSEQPAWVNTAKHLPFVSPFISYTYQMAKMTKTLAMDLATGSAADKAHAAAALATLYALPIGLSIVGKNAFLSSDDRKAWDKLQTLMPTNQRWQHKMPIGRDKDGTFRFLNINPWMPAADLASFIDRAARGDVEALMSENPVIGLHKSPIVSAFTDIASEKNYFTHQPITTAGQKISRASEALLPPIVGFQAKKIARGFTRNAEGGYGVETARTGNRDTPFTALAGLAGVSIQGTKPQNLFRRARAEADEQERQATAESRRITGTNAAPEVKAKARRRLFEKKKEILEDLQRRLGAAK